MSPADERGVTKKLLIFGLSAADLLLCKRSRQGVGFCERQGFYSKGKEGSKLRRPPSLPLNPNLLATLTPSTCIGLVFDNKKIKSSFIKGYSHPHTKASPEGGEARGGIGLRKSESPPLAEENAFPHEKAVLPADFLLGENVVGRWTWSLEKFL